MRAQHVSLQRQLTRQHQQWKYLFKQQQEKQRKRQRQEAQLRRQPWFQTRTSSKGAMAVWLGYYATWGPEAATVIQKHWHRYKARHAMQMQRAAAVYIQAIWRWVNAFAAIVPVVLQQYYHSSWRCVVLLACM